MVSNVPFPDPSPLLQTNLNFAVMGKLALYFSLTQDRVLTPPLPLANQ